MVQLYMNDCKRERGIRDSPRPSASMHVHSFAPTYELHDLELQMSGVLPSILLFRSYIREK
jgi:hypothetical protein